MNWMSNLLGFNCPHLQAQQAAARAHLERERAKNRGRLVEIETRRPDAQKG